MRININMIKSNNFIPLKKVLCIGWESFVLTQIGCFHLFVNEVSFALKKEY